MILSCGARLFISHMCEAENGTVDAVLASHTGGFFEFWSRYLFDTVFSILKSVVSTVWNATILSK